MSPRADAYRVIACPPYENLLEAEVGDGGAVEVAGRPTGLQRPAGTGPVIVAAWAAGVRLRAPGTPGIPATVEHVSPGPGRWEIALTAPCRCGPTSRSAPRRLSPVIASSLGWTRLSRQSSSRARAL
jgi:hypothetical protein